MKKWLFNPFIYIAGFRSLLLGLVMMLITACICYCSNLHFDGILHCGPFAGLPISSNLLEAMLMWLCGLLFFYPAALFFSASSVRFIDLAGTLAFARWPLIFVALLGFGMQPIHNMSDISGSFLVSALLSLAFVVWMVVLMFNAFSISSNIKGGKAAAIFITSFILAEVVYRFVIYELLKHFLN